MNILISCHIGETFVYSNYFRDVFLFFFLSLLCRDALINYVYFRTIQIEKNLR